MYSDFKRTFAFKLKAFCKHSTLHGFYYFYKSASWTVHLVWGCIILASLILCSFLSQMIWNKYVVDPTFTVVESTHHSMSEIPFPAVALCDSETVYGPKTENITSILLRRGFHSEQIDQFYESISDVKNVNYNPAPFVTKMHRLLEDLGITINSLIDILKKPCEDMLVACVWRSKTYECRDMFRRVFTVVGFCCQFDMEHFRSNVKESITFTSSIELGEALQVTVDEQAISPNGTPSNGGVMLYVFDENERLTILNNPVSLAVSIFYDISVDVWVIDSTDDVKALPVDVRKCLLSTDTSAGADFYRGCLSMLILRKVADRCRCLPFNFTENYMSEGNSITSESHCYERCDYVQYDTDVEYIRESRISKTYQGRFAVHFADNTCIKYRRQLLYSWDQMLANLGGIFGLCLGGSIISIIELLWFFIDLLFELATTTFGKKKISHKKRINQKLFAAKVSPMKYKNSHRKVAFIN